MIIAAQRNRPIAAFRHPKAFRHRHDGLLWWGLRAKLLPPLILRLQLPISPPLPSPASCPPQSGMLVGHGGLLAGDAAATARNAAESATQRALFQQQYASYLAQHAAQQQQLQLLQPQAPGQGGQKGAMGEQSFRRWAAGPSALKGDPDALLLTGRSKVYSSNGAFSGSASGGASGFTSGRSPHGSQGGASGGGSGFAPATARSLLSGHPSPKGLFPSPKGLRPRPPPQPRGYYAHHPFPAALRSSGPDDVAGRGQPQGGPAPLAVTRSLPDLGGAEGCTGVGFTAHGIPCRLRLACAAGAGIPE